MSARVLSFAAAVGRRRARRPLPSLAELEAAWDLPEESAADSSQPRDCVREFPAVSDAIQLAAYDRKGAPRLLVHLSLHDDVGAVADWMLQTVRSWH